MMWMIVLLLCLGALFLVAEILILPGISIGCVCSLICNGFAIYKAYEYYGVTTGTVVLGVALLLSLFVTILSLRAKTWQRLSLQQQVDSSVPTPEVAIQVGDRGIAVSRLAPMGKVSIGGAIYEAKSTDVYIDERSDVEVVGIENFSVIVKRVQ